MADHGAPLDGRAVAPAASNSSTLPADVEGGIGFALPRAGTPRLNSLATAPASIPAPIKSLYVAAGKKYQLPWTLLAGIGMEETAHGRTTATSTAGARGLMQFMPATFAAYGVDGDGDGATSITSDADSVFSAANYLTKSGVTKGEKGVRAALFAYNHATWYVNDVLHYAHAYGGGTVLGDPTTCPVTQAGNPTHAPLARATVANVLDWATSHTGDRYVFGANGPHAWDCSSFTQAAYRRAGLNLPRTAGAQRDWLAAGHGTRIPPGQRTPRRPDLLGLLPRPQRHRARRHRRRPQGPHHHRGQEPPRRRRQLHLHPHRARHPRDLAAQCSAPGDRHDHRPGPHSNPTSSPWSTATSTQPSATPHTTPARPTSRPDGSSTTSPHCVSGSHCSRTGDPSCSTPSPPTSVSQAPTSTSSRWWSFAPTSCSSAPTRCPLRQLSQPCPTPPPTPNGCGTAPTSTAARRADPSRPTARSR